MFWYISLNPLGVFNEENLVETFRLSSNKELSQKEYEVLLEGLCKSYKIDACSIGSVVEELNEKILKACNKIFEIESFLFSSSSKQGLNISLKNPKIYFFLWYIKSTKSDKKQLLVILFVIFLQLA